MAIAELLDLMDKFIAAGSLAEVRSLASEVREHIEQEYDAWIERQAEIEEEKALVRSHAWEAW